MSLARSNALDRWRALTRWKTIALAGGPGPGKIPVKKTITQKGKTFETTYWVKDPSLKKEGKPKPPPPPGPEAAIQQVTVGGKTFETSYGTPAQQKASAAAKKAAATKKANEEKAAAEAKAAQEKEEAAQKEAESKAKFQALLAKSAAKIDAQNKAAEEKAAADKAAAEAAFKKAKASAAAKKAAATKKANKEKAEALAKGEPPPEQPKPQAPAVGPPADLIGKHGAPMPASHKVIKGCIDGNGVPAAYDGVQYYGGDPGLASQVIGDWANSSTSKMAVRARGAACADVDREVTAIRRANSGYSAESIKSQLNLGRKDPKMAETLKAMAKVSQSMHPEETITIYRGMQESQASTIDHVKGTVQTGALVSFSESWTAARKFGPTVVEAKVPRSSIVMSHRAFSPKSESLYSSNKKLLTREKEIVIATTGVIEGIKVVKSDPLTGSTEYEY